MIKYYKFNNSRSRKQLFMVYVRVENHAIIDARGQQWAGPIRGMLEITKEEYDQVVQSYKDTQDIKMGDNVVCLEFVPMAERYGKVMDIRDNMVYYGDGYHRNKSDLRLDTVIHKH